MKQKIKNKKRTLRCSFLDGIFASLMGGFVQDYFTPFLLAIGGTVGQVGLLGAAPNLFASIIQLKSPGLVEKFRARKPIMDLFVPLQAVSLLLMAALAIFSHSGPAPFMIAVVLFTAFGALVTPAWSSMMSEIVDKDKWGEYFGWRNQALGIITIIAALSASMILHFAKVIGPGKEAGLFTGFAVIFGAAFIFRIFSWRFLRCMEEPRLKQGHSGGTVLKGLFPGRGASNFTRYVFFVGAFNLSVNLAGPFFPVLMLKDLHFSYPTYIAINSAQALAIYITMRRWGRHADRIGNMKIIRATSRLAVFVPVLWLVSRNPIYLIFAQVFSGFVWAGFNLSTSNFVYDASSPGERTRSVSQLNAVGGMGLCIGALAGGLLIPVLPPIFGQKILTLFLVSSAARLAVAFFIPFRIREVRRVENISSVALISSMAGITSAYSRRQPDLL